MLTLERKTKRFLSKSMICYIYDNTLIDIYRKGNITNPIFISISIYTYLYMLVVVIKLPELINNASVNETIYIGISNKKLRELIHNASVNETIYIYLYMYIYLIICE